MKIKTTFLLAIVVFGFGLSNCKKDEPAPETPNEPQATEHNFYPLDEGAFWVYNHTTYDSNGTMQTTNMLDTVRVIGDTMIDGQTFHIVEKDLPSENMRTYMNFNSGSIFSSGGNVICPPADDLAGIFNDQYQIDNAQDTVYRAWDTFSDGHVITYNGNTYPCIQRLSHYEIWPNYGGNTLIDTFYYSSIGPLRTSFSYFSGTQNVGILVDHEL